MSPDLRRKARSLQRLIEHQLPVLLGAAAIEFAERNFERQGFQGSSLQKWHPARRPAAAATLLATDDTPTSEHQDIPKELFDVFRNISSSLLIVTKSKSPRVYFLLEIDALFRCT